MYERVVVLLDSSELAEQVLPHVAEIVRGRRSEVHLLSVAPVVALTATIVDVHPVPVTADLGVLEAAEREQIRHNLEEYLRGVASRLQDVVTDVRTVVRFGRPAEEILRYAVEVEADLIALSTHGRSGLSRWVFGSVAEKVLRGAPCPVLLVRIRPAGEEQVPGDELVRSTAERALVPVKPALHRRILVPLDGSALAECVLPHVTALIRPGLTHVYLLSVLAAGFGERTVALMTSYPPGLRLSTTALSRARAHLEVYLRAVADRLRQRGASVGQEIREGNPAEEILRYVPKIRAEMIVMNAHGLSGASQWVYGSVASRVLRGASCPVLLVRASEELAQSKPERGVT